MPTLRCRDMPVGSGTGFGWRAMLSGTAAEIRVASRSSDTIASSRYNRCIAIASGIANSTTARAATPTIATSTRRRSGGIRVISTFCLPDHDAPDRRRAPDRRPAPDRRRAAGALPRGAAQPQTFFSETDPLDPLEALGLAVVPVLTFFFLCFVTVAVGLAAGCF